MSLSGIDSSFTEPVKPNIKANTPNPILKTLIFFPPFIYFFESSGRALEQRRCHAWLRRSQGGFYLCFAACGNARETLKCLNTVSRLSQLIQRDYLSAGLILRSAN